MQDDRKADMLLTIDIGNTATKLALFSTTEGEGSREPAESLKVEGLHFEYIKPWLEGRQPEKAIASTTVKLTPSQQKQLEDVCNCKILWLGHTTPIPIRNLYQTPETLGTDRLAAVIGAYHETLNLTGSHQDALVIDAGTAITYDLVTADGEYLGGNISPGISLRFRALHEFTSRLPLVTPKASPKKEKPISIGCTTETAIRNGVNEGVRLEIEGYIRRLTVKFPYLCVFFTGGDHFDFDKTLKNRIFADDFLVAKGLHCILKYQ